MIVRPNPTQPGRPNRVPQPPKMERGKIPDARRNGTIRDIRPPQQRDGRPISQRPLENRHGRVIAPQHNHVTIINNNTYITNISNVQGRWDRNDHRYGWYDWNGHHVCHHYDSYGYHWWGWYIGDYYFWTRYYNDYYWWYDPYWHRWCYMHDNRWWWRDPDHVEIVYVYQGDSYYRYQDSTGGVVMQPDPTPPADAPPPSEEPAPAPDQKTFTSLDGTRTVTVTTDEKLSAFLNDTAETPAFQPVWLGDGVTDVRFKNNADGSLNEILTITNDGSFGIFDKDGYAVNAAVADVSSPEAAAEAFTPEQTSSVGRGLDKSEMFNSLQSGSLGW